MDKPIRKSKVGYTRNSAAYNSAYKQRAEMH